jgi:hypothetical protein
MNKQSYKKAALEHGDFQSPVQNNSTPRRNWLWHIISNYGRNQAGRNENAYFMALVEILSQALVPEVIQCQRKPLVIGWS